MSSAHQLSKISKFLSFVLRHKPEAIGLALDANGWADIDELVDKAVASGEAANLNRALIERVVESSEKRRFIISADGQRIRANQGHSLNIDLQLTPATPPDILYHGTAARFLESIMKDGLKPQQRQHVHLSTNTDTATAVGRRHGSPAVLEINARLMCNQGLIFYKSENGVWLTEAVPCEYIIGLTDHTI